jgi:hypothetical protein
LTCRRAGGWIEVATASTQPVERSHRRRNRSPRHLSPTNTRDARAQDPRDPLPARQFALCDALTGREDGRQTLENLERGNLFVVPLAVPAGVALIGLGISLWRDQRKTAAITADDLAPARVESATVR